MAAFASQQTVKTNGILPFKLLIVLRLAMLMVESWTVLSKKLPYLGSVELGVIAGKLTFSLENEKFLL